MRYTARMLTVSTLALVTSISIFAMEEHHFPLHQAAQDGKISSITELIKQGYDVNARDSDGCTPLGIAILKKDVTLTTVECLLKNGADPDLEFFGFSPLHQAVIQNSEDPKIVVDLLKHGATPDLTVLEKAIDSNHAEQAWHILIYFLAQYKTLDDIPKDVCIDLLRLSASEHLSHTITDKKSLHEIIEQTISDKNSILFNRVLERCSQDVAQEKASVKINTSTSNMLSSSLLSFKNLTIGCVSTAIIGGLGYLAYQHYTQNNAAKPQEDVV